MNPSVRTDTLWFHFTDFKVLFICDKHLCFANRIIMVGILLWTSRILLCLDIHYSFFFTTRNLKLLQETWNVRTDLESVEILSLKLSPHQNSLKPWRQFLSIREALRKDWSWRKNFIWSISSHPKVYPEYRFSAYIGKCFSWTCQRLMVVSISLQRVGSI